MIAPSLRSCLIAAGLTAAGAVLAAPPAKWDVAPPAARRPIVELAQQLASVGKPAPLPPGLVQPFNPVAFGQPDPEELRAIAAAQAAAQAASAAVKPPTDTDRLNDIASRITPSGSLEMGGEALLIFGQKRLRVGDRLTVTYEGQDYVLELTAIDRTTFTLRLNQGEVTRRIKPGKTP